MRLKRNQPCPIPGHGWNCVCRDEKRERKKLGSRWEQVRVGVSRIRDQHARHPDGYRYRLSKAEMGKVLLQKVREQKGLCSICGDPLLDMNDVDPDHRDPCGMGGGWRDDRPENIGAAHHSCNFEKGSVRVIRIVA